MGDTNLVESGNLITDLDSLAKDPRATDDYSKILDEKIPIFESQARNGELSEAIENLLIWEKKCRLSCDAISLSRVVCSIIKLSRECGGIDLSLSYLPVLCKKRCQLKRPIIDMIHVFVDWLDDETSSAFDIDTKYKVIHCLSSVTEGKLFVEVERARIIKKLAYMKETEGKVEEACKLLQDVAVDTFGSMSMFEKIKYILDQMRLLLTTHDYVRCQIISKKINTKLIEGVDYQSLKLTFYEYMTHFWLYEQDLVQVAECYKARYNTKLVQDDDKIWKKILESYVLYVMLSPRSNNQIEALKTVLKNEKKKLQEIPVIMNLIQEFLRDEITVWPLNNEQEIQACFIFKMNESFPGMGDISLPLVPSLSNIDFNSPESRWVAFKKRLVQRNIVVISKYYSCINFSRIIELTGVLPEDLEAEVCGLVGRKLIYAKIDRPGKIISFEKRDDTSEKLILWNNEISKVLELTDDVNQLIMRERMVSAVKAKQMKSQIARA